MQMKYFKAVFITENAVAMENTPEEVATTLERIAAQVREGKGAGVIYDSNGNKVGFYGYSWTKD